jgi:predicted DNA-binding protein
MNRCNHSEILFTYLPPELAKWVKENASKEHRSISNYIRFIIEKFKENNQKGEAPSCILPQ